MYRHPHIETAMAISDLCSLLFRKFCRKTGNLHWIEDKRENAVLAIEFALQVSADDAYWFLRYWREGDWPAVKREFPEWRYFMLKRGINVDEEPRDV